MAVRVVAYGACLLVVLGGCRFVPSDPVTWGIGARRIDSSIELSFGACDKSSVINEVLILDMKGRSLEKLVDPRLQSRSEGQGGVTTVAIDAAGLPDQFSVQASAGRGSDSQVWSDDFVRSKIGPVVRGGVTFNYERLSEGELLDPPCDGDG